jgi:hypothetical protein
MGGDRRMTPIEQSTKRIAFLNAESYAEYAFRYCAERALPWRDEYARPMPGRDAVPFGPIAQARQDRGMAKILNHRGP